MWDVILSRLFFGRVKVVRRPFYVRGKKYIKINRGFTSGVGLRLDAFPTEDKVCLEIGDDVQVNDYVHIAVCNSVKIGRNVLIASKVFITDHNHGFYGFGGRHSSPEIPPLKRPLSSAPVVIKDNVWIGEFAAVLPGVTIGEGSIIGAMSVVTKDIPPFCIAVGSPVKVVKKYNFNSKKWEKM